MALKDLTQTERLGLRYIQPIYLVDIFLDGKTLHLSDRDFRYDYGAGVIYYESYLHDLTGLGDEIRHAGGGPNSHFSLVCKNQKILTYDYFIQMQADYEFVRRPVHIYELRLVEDDETFPSDVRMCIQKGHIEKVRDISREKFTIDCSSRLFFLRDKLGLAKVNLTDFPSADPDDVGKYRNDVFGAVEHIPCRAVKAGAIDTLREDLDATAPSFYVSGVSKTDFPGGAVVVQIDEEKIQGTYDQAEKQFTSCTRGYDGTTAVAHDKGAAVAEVLTEYVYEVSKRPMKSIDEIFVDGVKQVSGVTAYTGQSGDELPGYEGTAVLKFDALPVIKKQVNIDIDDQLVVADTIDVEDSIDIDQGSHAHPVGNVTVVWNFDTGWAAEGSPTYPYAAADGDLNTYADVNSSGDKIGVKRAFYQEFSGTPRKFRLCGKSGHVNGKWHFAFGGHSLYFYSGDHNIVKKSAWYDVGSGLDTWEEWNNAVGYVVCDDPSDNNIVGEVWVEINYAPSTPASPASGVAKTGTVTKIGTATRDGAISLYGNSSAETVIGRLVTVTGQGQPDDASGTYTGTPGALIERPDHVFKYILVNMLGQTPDDLGDSFASSAAEYDTRNYKFGFILHEVATKADELMARLAEQCRSDFLDWAGKWELMFNPDAAPAADLVLSGDDLGGEPTFDHTDSAEIKNKLNGYYRRDYRKSGTLGDRYTGMVVASTGSADLPEDVEFSAVRVSAMCQDVLNWMLKQKKDVLVEAEIKAKWLAIMLAPGKYFSLEWDLYDGTLYKVLEVKPDRGSGVVKLEGRKFAK